MKVYYSVDEVPEIKNPVITLGTFDGVHLGHQKIIKFLKENAQKVEGESVLFTFHPHPRIVLHPEDHNLELIQDIDRRIERLAEEGVDHLILHPFTLEFAKQTATEFVRNILVNKLGVRVMTIGYNHHFGKNREGNIDLLQELGAVYNFDVVQIPAFEQDEIKISSTKIRSAIKEGDITKANAYLGSPFCFKGTVKDGDKIGTTIGFPTANIQLFSETQILPNIGVYAVQVKIDGEMYDGMMNIGYRPTVSNSNEKRIEVNIFNFNRNLYGTKIVVFVIAKIREEQSFNSIEDLKKQLHQDEINSKRILDQSTSSL
ncbi:bifunctional riboflavin kinase/FAD synthetase [Paracrocinitomix mangrovi]|uniref:bifunctional riboflavin kinase/FAD synthetase n=1 Tax=Paracrocinitomix mangrovi TaxID=2862509 RepID=UPI001C8D4D7C|nr:bifunctional riboflavin kinase/FAD synthetase [Paracrocinitomix mangrovi]UKN03589.1 bifunctional riboflavin kinase/FAD synthetase [Paracrocinitomix mangrovi]